jgi:CheY-like chemotaxis protein
MDRSTIYSKTAKGMTEYLAGGKNLAREHARVLALINGTSSLNKLIESGALIEGKYAPTIAALVEQGLIRVFEQVKDSGNVLEWTPATVADGNDFPEALPTLVVEELSPQESVQIWAQARRGAEELRNAGFYSYGAKSPLTMVGEEHAGLKALVVEDDEELAELLVVLLSEKGMVVQVARDIPSAMAAVQTGAAPDMVLLDIGLPGMPGKDGFDILALIRRNDSWAKVPVIMVTAEVSDDQVMKGLKAGADGYMFKPFKWEALYGCIKEVLGI